MRRLALLAPLALLSACLTSQEEFEYLLEHSMDQDDDGHRDPKWEGGDDCDDADPERNPSATEVCDGKDNDCDGLTDEGFDTTWYQDIDQDGFYGMEPVEGCEPPDDFARHLVGEDCNDRSTAAFPGAPEYCEGQDNDCDGLVDEGEAADASTFYADADQDGYGDPSAVLLACALPDGASTLATDCDDSDPNVHPGAEEICNNAVDDNCDLDANGCVWEEQIYLDDADLVLFGPSSYAAFGSAACGVEDITGDGVSDLVVTAPGMDGRGAIYVFAGPLDSGSAQAYSASATLTSNDWVAFGTSYATADLDGDGLLDLVAGDPRPGEPDPGNVYGFLGPVAGQLNSSSADFKLEGPKAYDEFGMSVAAGADLDDDGHSDILIGAPGYEGDRGASFLYTGPYDNARQPSASGSKTGSRRERMGVYVTFIDDVNADGLDDAIVSSEETNDSSQAGSVSYLLRSPQPSGETLTELRWFRGTDSTSRFMIVPDQDDDGEPELLISVPTELSASPSSLTFDPNGVLHIEAPNSSRNIELIGSNAYLYSGASAKELGRSLSWSGDYDDDGEGELVVGATASAQDLDVAYVIPLPLGQDSYATEEHIVHITAMNADDDAGASVCGALDLNGDAYPDLVIGAPGDATNGSYAGAVYVIFGRGL